MFRGAAITRHGSATPTIHSSGQPQYHGHARHVLTLLSLTPGEGADLVAAWRTGTSVAVGQVADEMGAEGRAVPPESSEGEPPMDEAHVVEGGLSVGPVVTPAGESRESEQRARYAAATALLVIDVQNDFADPSGALSVPGGAGVVAVANREISAALQAGVTMVLTQDWHPAVTPHFLTGGGRWPVHCVAGTPGAELHPDLEAPAEAIHIRKGTGAMDGYSAFAERDPRNSAVRSTGLENDLRARGITDVVIVGLATDYCVLQTALDAVLLGFDTRVLVEGVRAVEVEPGDGDKALQEMRGAGIRLS